MNAEEETEGRNSWPGTSGRGVPATKELIKEDGCCNGVNGALNFTLNCCRVRLTSRDTNLRTGPEGGKQQGPETRD